MSRHPSSFSLPLAQLHGCQHVSRTKHAAGAALSPLYQSINQSVNQSSLAIAYLFFLSDFHIQTLSIRDWTRKKWHQCPKRKGLPYCPRSRQWRDIFSLLIKSQSLSSHFCLCPCFLRFKGKVSVYTMDALQFLSNGERNKGQRTAG